MIGDRIKERREQLGMSQEELAYRMGYKHKSSINKIETQGRKVPQDKILMLANILETTTNYLLEDDDYSGNDYNLKIAVGERIKKARLENGITTSELANKLGLPVNRVIAMENGTNRTFDRDLMIKLAHALNTSSSYFLNDNHNVDIGRNIEAMRLMSNTSIQDISIATNTEVSRIIKVENGTPPTIEEIERVAKFFNIPEQWIINFDFTSVMNDERIKLAFQILSMTKDITKEQRENIISYARFILTK